MHIMPESASTAQNPLQLYLQNANILGKFFRHVTWWTKYTRWHLEEQYSRYINVSQAFVYFRLRSHEYSTTHRWCITWPYLYAYSLLGPSPRVKKNLAGGYSAADTFSDDNLVWCYSTDDIPTMYLCLVIVFWRCTESKLLTHKFYRSYLKISFWTRATD